MGLHLHVDQSGADTGGRCPHNTLLGTVDEYNHAYTCMAIYKCDIYCML